MADDKELQVRITSDTSGLKAGTQEAASIFSSATTQIQTSAATMNGVVSGQMSQLSGAFSNAMRGMASMAATLGPAIAGYLSFRGFKDAIEGALKYNESVHELSEIMGIAAGQASVLNIALQMIGKTAEDYIAVNFKLARQIKSNEEDLKSLGLVTRDVNGHLLNQTEIFQNAISTMMTYKEGTDRNQFALYAFGRGAAEVIEYQRLTNKVMEEATALAKDYGIVLTDQGVEATKQMGVALNTLGVAWKAVKIVVGNELLPVLKEIIPILRDTLVDAVHVLGTAVKGLVTAFEFIRTPVIAVVGAVNAALYSMSDLIMGILRAAILAMKGDWEGAWEALKTSVSTANGEWLTYNKTIVNTAKDSWNRIKEIWSKSPMEPSETRFLKGGKAFVEPPKKTETSRVSEWELELKEIMMAQKKFDGLSIEEERGFWEAKLVLTKSGTAEEISVREKLFQVAKRAYEEQKKIAEAAAKAEQKALEEDSKAMGDFAQETIDANNKLAELDATAAKAFQDMKEAAHIKIEIDLAEMRNEAVEAAIKGTIDAAISDVKRLEEEAAKIKKVWQNIGDAIYSAFSTSINGIIQGTITLRKAMQNIFQSIVLSFSNMVLKMVTDWGAGEMAKLGISKMFHTILIALGIETAAAQTATTAAGSAATVGVKAGEATAVVTSNAVEAASGAAASQASIPYVGPILAAAAFAAMLALVLGSLGSIKSAAGGWDVDRDSLAMLHKSEMVIPSGIAEGLRGMISGGGAKSAANVRQNIKIVAGDVDSFRGSSGRKVFQQLKGHARNLGIRINGK